MHFTKHLQAPQITQYTKKSQTDFEEKFTKCLCSFVQVDLSPISPQTAEKLGFMPHKQPEKDRTLIF